MKSTGEKIVALTAYDYPMAQILSQSQVDLILVGDTLGVVVLGFYLGGIIGIGTVLYAVGIGYSVSIGLFLVGKFYK